MPWDKARQKLILENCQMHFDKYSGRHFPFGSKKSRVTNNFSREEIEEHFNSQMDELFPLSSLIHKCLAQIPFESIADLVETLDLACL